MHAIAVQDLAAQHPFELGRRARAMRAGGDQNRHVFRPHVRHLAEERREHLASRLRARHVADRDGDRPARASQRRKRRTAAQRRTYGGTKGRYGVVDRRTADRFNHRHPFVGKGDLQSIRAEIQTTAHPYTITRDDVRYHVVNR